MTAKTLLIEAGVTLTETQVCRLFLELIETSGGGKIKKPDSLMKHCRHVITQGIRTTELLRKSVTFNECFKELLADKKRLNRSALTIRDFAYYCRRMMKVVPRLKRKILREITTEYCEMLIESAFNHGQQKKKARAILSGMFNYGKRRGWNDYNPAECVEVPRVEEREIKALTLPEISRLLRTANKPQFQLSALVGVMLFAGVRPHEAMRLTWGNIDLSEREITIPPRHSKTGGGRVIPIYPPLYEILKQCRQSDGSLPLGTAKRAIWVRFRHAAGFREWQPDVLRHTFASYHAKHFSNLPELQMIMGHRDLSLLRTRYVNFAGITRKTAANFWGGEVNRTPATRGRVRAFYRQNVTIVCCAGGGRT